MKLLDRLDAAFQETADEDNRELCRLLAQGDNLQPGAEDAITTIARSLGLTKDQVAERVVLVAELVKLLPVVAGAAEKRDVARARKREYLAAKDRAKKEMDAIDATLKKLYIASMGADSENLQITSAQTRLESLRRNYPDLYDAVSSNTGIAIHISTPQPSPSTPALPQVADVPADAPKLSTDQTAASPGVVEIDGVLLDPKDLPPRPRPSHIGANFSDLREQNRTQRRRQLMERRSRSGE